jgi:hypothetical protein
MRRSAPKRLRASGGAPARYSLTLVGLFMGLILGRSPKRGKSNASIPHRVALQRQGRLSLRGAAPRSSRFATRGRSARRSWRCAPLPPRDSGRTPDARGTAAAGPSIGRARLPGHAAAPLRPRSGRGCPHHVRARAPHQPSARCDGEFVLPPPSWVPPVDGLYFNLSRRAHRRQRNRSRPHSDPSSGTVARTPYTMPNSGAGGGSL